MSIDDHRHQFLPTLWNEPTEAQKVGDPVSQVFEQVWFPGVHADVGGGYADAGLSNVALGWMIDKALSARHPLLFSGDPGSGLDPRPTGRRHGPLGGLLEEGGLSEGAPEHLQGASATPLQGR